MFFQLDVIWMCKIHQLAKSNAIVLHSICLCIHGLLELFEFSFFSLILLQKMVTYNLNLLNIQCLFMIWIMLHWLNRKRIRSNFVWRKKKCCASHRLWTQIHCQFQWIRNVIWRGMTFFFIHQYNHRKSKKINCLDASDNLIVIAV